MLVAVGLLCANAVVSRSQGWSFPEVPWWMWLILAIPEALLLITLVVSALGGVRPGLHHEFVIARLDSWRWPASPPPRSLCGRSLPLT
jgi:hypothetical protein